MKTPGVLLVQNEAILALDLERQLKKFGYDPLGIVYDGEEAIKKTRELNPDIVLTEDNLEGRISGVDVARLIADNHGIPVVIITSFSDEVLTPGLGSYYSFNYILKPFQSRELKLAMDGALHRHNMAKQLQASEDKYRSFFEEDLSGIFQADGEGRIKLCNNSFARMFQFDTTRDARGFKLSSLFEDAAEWSDFENQLSERGRVNLLERVFLTYKGQKRIILGNYMARFSPQGELIEIIGYLYDTTEKKRLEDMLFQSQKMEAVGRLTGGIAHDFNNVLTIILGYTAMMKDKVSSGESIEDDLVGVEAATAKAASLTRQLLTFSRRQVIKPVPVDLNKLLLDLEKMLMRLIGEQVEIYVYPHAYRGNIYADPGKLEQVILNLAVNARDAMPTGGRITLETAERVVQFGETTLMGAIKPGHWVTLTVADTGTGIPKEIQRKIFDPFFTTKSESQGTGLGLSSVYGILKQSGAHISLESEPDKGAEFTIFLPPTTEDPGIVHEAAGDFPRGNGEVILVVDDDELVRKVLSHGLTKGGYDVVTAENAGEALLLCESHGNINVIITDMVMPHVGGKTLLNRLKKDFPQIKGLLMTGHPKELGIDKGLIETIPVVEKPIELPLLFKTIRSVLDSGHT